MPTRKQVLVSALHIIEEMEWQFHNAAENRYCQFCIDWKTQSYDDMEEHNPNCSLMETISDLKNLIEKE